MSLFEHFHIAEAVPFTWLHCKHIRQFLGTERQERSKRHGKICCQLQGEIQNCSDTPHVGFCQFPRFVIGKIFIAYTRHVHGFFLRIAELEIIQQIFHFLLGSLEFGNHVFIRLVKFSPCRNLAFEIFMRKHHAAVYEISVYGNQLVIVAGLEIFPSKVVVFGFRGVSRKHIPQHVLFAFKIPQIFVQPYRPISRRGYFIALQVQELVCRHVVGQDIRPFRFKHGRKYYAVENDVVLANEMDKTGVLVLPPFFPIIRQQLFGVAYISDRCVEPDIQHFAFRTLDRNRYPPIQIAAYGTWLQTSIEPAFALPVNIGFPLLMPL